MQTRFVTSDCTLQLTMAVKEANPLNPILFYRGADKSLARATSRCILFDGENISFDASLVIYIYIYIYTYIYTYIFLQL